MKKINMSDIQNINLLKFAEFKFDEIIESVETEYIEPIDFISLLPNVDKLDDFITICLRYLNGIDTKYLKSISNTCVTLLSSKAHDYSDNNNRYSNFEFIYGYLHKKYSFPTHITTHIAFDSLIAVKIARLTELIKNNKTPKNESVIDSIVDLINYRFLLEGYRLGLK